MIAQEFTSPSYAGNNLSALQTCKNLYPEKTTFGFILRGVSGSIAGSDVSLLNKSRGSYVSGNGRIFTANANSLYELTVSGWTNRGTLSASSGDVFFADNGLELIVVQFQGPGYYLNFDTNTFTQITDVNYPTAPRGVAFLGSYFIIIDGPDNGSIGTGSGDTFYISQPLAAATWTPSTFATAEFSSDQLVSVRAIGDNLVFIGTRTTETWSPYAGDFPFIANSGSALQVGTDYSSSVAQNRDSVFMIANGAANGQQVLRIVPGSYKVISTPYIAAQITAAPDTAFCYRENGHDFYVISYKSPDKKYVYDISEGSWHERDTDERMILNGNTDYPVTNTAGILLDCGVSGTSGFLRNNTLYGSLSSPGNPITRERVFGPFGDGDNRLFHKRVVFSLEAAYDFAPTSISVTSFDATLSWSDDGGYSFTGSRTLTSTVINTTNGQRLRLEANRLGSSRQRYYKISFSATASLMFQSCNLTIEPGAF